MSTTYQINFNRLKKIAEENGFVFNPDPERVKKVIGLMSDNFDLVEEWVCPCKQQFKPPQKGKDTLCPCPEWIDEIKDIGHCYCKLFFSKEKAAKIK